MTTLVVLALLAASTLYVWNNPKECLGALATLPADTLSMLSKPWAEKKPLDKSYLTAFALFIVAVLPLPYGYYSLLRLAICICLSFYFLEANKKALGVGWSFGFAGLAILYNPIFPIHLASQAGWIVVNAATILFLYRAKLVIEAEIVSTPGVENVNAALNFPSGKDLAGGEQTATADDKHADWQQQFILYYVASEMRFVNDEALPDTVRGLASGCSTGASQQSILVSLQHYLRFMYNRDRKQDDLSAILQVGQRFLRAELHALNSSYALRSFIARMHRKDTDTDLSIVELEAEYGRLFAHIKTDRRVALSVRNAMLRDSVEELFANRHGLTINAFVAKLLAATGQQ